MLRERVRGGRAGRRAARASCSRETGYLEALRGRADDRGAGADREPRGARQRRARVRRATRAEQPSLDEFLQQIALVADADTRTDDEGLVTLMTLHNAKGLEYPIVFMIGCEEGVFPHSRALEEGGLEEERRLCYVGITRAQRDLYLTYARTRTVFGARSYGAQPLPRRDPGRADRPRGAGAARLSARSAAPCTSWGAQRRRRRRTSATSCAAASASATTSSTPVRRGRRDRRRARRDRRDPLQPRTAPSASWSPTCAPISRR